MPQVTSVDGHRIFIADGTTIGDYTVQSENFNDEVTSATDLETMGWTEADIGTATARGTLNTAGDHYFTVNAGTKADSGVNMQYASVTTAASTSRPHKIITPITATASNMDGRSLFMFARIGFAHTTAVWDNKLIFGWTLSDTSMMTAATGAQSIGTGGGLYFHFQESAIGPVLFSAQRKAAAASTTEVWTQGAATSATVIGDWIDIGFVATWVDASDDADNGTVYAYKDGALVATDSNNLPMTTAAIYAVGIELLNGPATSQNVDMGIDWMVTGVTR